MNDKITIVFGEEDNLEISFKEKQYNIDSEETIRFNVGGVELKLNSQTGVLQLIDNTGKVLSEVDFPTEKIITNAYYDYDNQELVLEFENAQAVRVPIKTDFSNHYTIEQVDNLLNSLKLELNGIIQNNINSLDKKITDLENNKANRNELFSGSYNDLSDKPTIPSKISDLTNDREFVTNTTNNLVNYYSKSEVFTKNEVLSLIDKISTMSMLVVDTLPTENISSTTIYLLPTITSETQNVFEEYIYVNNQWELIGTTKIDLTGLVKPEDVMPIVEENSEEVESLGIEEVEELNIATSTNYDVESDEQIPTTKAVKKITDEIVSQSANSTEVKKYTLPLDEASWLRIAKVKDTSKIASGIFTFNTYGIKEDGTKDTLNAVTFSINSGVDRKQAVFGDILPLSVSPDMKGASSSDGSVDNPPSSASIEVEEENTPVVANAEEAISSEIPDSSIGGSGGSNSGSSFGLSTVTIEEYEQNIYVCGLISYPNVEYYTGIEVELILENNSNYEALETFEKVDFTMIESKGQMPVLEGMTLEEGKNYNFILKGNLGTYIENIKNTKPLEINIKYEYDSEEYAEILTLINYIGGPVKEFQIIDENTREWIMFKRDETLDTVLNDIQYYGYKGNPLLENSIKELLVKDDPVIAWETIPYYTDGTQYNSNINYSDENGYQQKVLTILGEEIPPDDTIYGFFYYMHSIFYESENNSTFYCSSGLKELISELECLFNKSLGLSYYRSEIIIPEKVSLKVIYEFGNNTTNEPFNVILNDEVLSEISETNPEVIINEFVYGKDNLCIYAPEGAYFSGKLVADISNFDYKVFIPYTPVITKVIKEYSIAEDNPYNISLMVEENIEHNIIDKYNMQSIYKQVDKIEDEAEDISRRLSEFQHSVPEIVKQNSVLCKTVNLELNDYGVEISIENDYDIANCLVSCIYELFSRGELDKDIIYKNFYILADLRFRGTKVINELFYISYLNYNSYIPNNEEIGLFFTCQSTLQSGLTIENTTHWSAGTTYSSIKFDNSYLFGSLSSNQVKISPAKILKNLATKEDIKGIFTVSRSHIIEDDIKDLAYSCYLNYITTYIKKTTAYSTLLLNEILFARLDTDNSRYIFTLIESQEEYYVFELRKLIDGSGYRGTIIKTIDFETIEQITYERFEAPIKEYVDEAISNAITKVLNEEV